MERQTNNNEQPQHDAKLPVRRSNFTIKSVFTNNKEYKVENGFIVYNINDVVKILHQ